MRGGHLAFVSLAALAFGMVHFWGQAASSFHVLSGAIIVDGLGASFGLTATMGAFISVLLAKAYLREHQMAQGEFYALILLSTGGYAGADYGPAICWFCFWASRSCRWPFIFWQAIGGPSAAPKKRP